MERFIIGAVLLAIAAALMIHHYADKIGQAWDKLWRKE